MNLRDAYKNKKILITGHTGFKGSWMLRLLSGLGAETYGYSLEAPTEPSLFKLIGLDRAMGDRSRIADIRDLDSLMAFMTEVEPDVCYRLAGQQLTLTGLPSGTPVSVVTVDGKVVGTATAGGAACTLRLPDAQAVYIVKTPHRSFKLHSHQ